MAVNVRPYRGQKGTWEVDIRVELASGTIHRERRRAPVRTRAGALRWGRERERMLLLRSTTESIKPVAPVPAPERRDRKVPSLREFVPRYFEGYCEANRNKPSTIESKESLLRLYLLPRLGSKRLDEIHIEDVQAIKAQLRDKHSKTVNNVLSVLNTILRCAAEWGVIDDVPVRARWLRTSSVEIDFFDTDEYEALVQGAEDLDPRYLVVVLLGGEAGLRRGEMLGLRWRDIDLDRRVVTVARSTWNGHTTVPKGGRIRTVPMTSRLRAALRALRKSVRGPQVLLGDRGRPATAKNVRTWLLRVQAQAGLSTRKGAHTLRHTFCSHLAMKGAPPRAIQELAGHRHITTTERYMHLSPAALEGAIRLLENGRT